MIKTKNKSMGTKLRRLRIRKRKTPIKSVNLILTILKKNPDLSYFKAKKMGIQIRKQAFYYLKKILHNQINYKEYNKIIQKLPKKYINPIKKTSILKINGLLLTKKHKRDHQILDIYEIKDLISKKSFNFWAGIGKFFVGFINSTSNAIFHIEYQQKAVKLFNFIVSKYNKIPYFHLYIEFELKDTAGNKTYTTYTYIIQNTDDIVNFAGNYNNFVKRIQQSNLKISNKDIYVYLMNTIYIKENKVML